MQKNSPLVPVLVILQRGRVLHVLRTQPGEREGVPADVAQLAPGLEVEHAEPGAQEESELPDAPDAAGDEHAPDLAVREAGAADALQAHPCLEGDPAQASAASEGSGSESRDGVRDHDPLHAGVHEPVRTDRPEALREPQLFRVVCEREALGEHLRQRWTCHPHERLDREFFLGTVPEGAVVRERAVYGNLALLSIRRRVLVRILFRLLTAR